MLYDILVQQQPEGTYRATVLGWPDLSADGKSEKNALDRIRKSIRERLSRAKVIRIAVDEDAVETHHPWQPFLGMWKDDPTFDNFIAIMQASRQEMDQTIE